MVAMSSNDCEVDGIQSSVTDEKATTAPEEVIIIETGSRKPSRRTKIQDDDEPLVDRTAALQLRSKKTERAQKRLHKRQQKAANRQNSASLLDLPAELLQEIVGYLRPSEILPLLQVNRGLHDFIRENENAVARDIIRRRYWVLSKCFVLPVAFEDVDSSSRPSLLSDRRQEMIQMHKKPYQHVKGIDPLRICTCMSCVFAWNHLCMILDLAYWQKNLNQREPITMIPRGTTPEWNRTLLDSNANIVERAMDSRLVYAAILEKHLQSTVQTIFRTFRGKKTVHPKRLYHLTPAEAGKETDEFLERSGPPSYEFPWHRDNYYGLEAYVPNRKWSREKGKWLYYADGQHERDLQWVKDRFTPGIASTGAIPRTEAIPNARPVASTRPIPSTGATPATDKVISFTRDPPSSVKSTPWIPFQDLT